MLIKRKRSSDSISSSSAISVRRTLHINIYSWPPLVVPIVSTGSLTFRRKEGVAFGSEPDHSVSSEPAVRSKSCVRARFLPGGGAGGAAAAAASTGSRQLTAD